MAGNKVIGRNAGTATITYSVSNSCGTANATKPVTVLPATTVGVIYGPEKLCTGATVQFAISSGLGGWSVSNNFASISGSGFLTGIAQGVDTISYTVTGVCGTAVATKTVSIAAPPTAGEITGPSCVIIGNTITLTDTVPGGVWSSSNTSATVDNGIVTGKYYGRCLIKYTVTNDCGSVMVGVPIDVEYPLTPIVGVKEMCISHVSTFAHATAGGIWSSSNIAVAPIGSATGKVTGLSAGSAIITYATRCSFVTTTVTIGELPPITGPNSVFPGKTITLKAPVAGGWWTSSNTAVATIAQTGIVTGVASGTATITFEQHTGCIVSLPITVETFITPPVITPTSTQKLTLYPNPNNGEFVLSGALNSTTTLDAHIHIVNTAGQIIDKRTALVFSNLITERFYLSDRLPAGMYFLLLETEKQREVFRFEVHH
jgi:hypothetical protein